jgi:predicted HAD superfamily hydrolase
MYLPKKIISDILNNNGYKNIKVYVSNEYHKHKGNMTLYELVQEKEKFEKENWLHIGDNYYSDYEQARNFGISSYHYKNVLSRSKNLGDNLSVASSIIFAISNNAVNNGLEVDYWEKFGIINAAPLYYAFANWVYKNNIDHDNIYFFARDGYIIKKIFDNIKTVENSKIFSSYLYTSRRATQLPLLTYEKKTVAVDMLCGVNFQCDKNQKLRTIFECFNLEADKYSEVIKKYGFLSPDDIITIENHIYYRQLISEVYDDFKQKMNEQKELIEKYLIQEKVYEHKKMNAVDIGWRGSIQYVLSKISKVELFGYYFCTGPYIYEDILYNTRGFLLNYNKPETISNLIINNMMMFEFIFSSPEGSLVRYEEQDNKVVPVLSENKDYIKEVSIIQDAAINIIDKYLKYYKYTSKIDSEESLLPYKNYLETRDYNDVKMVSTLFTNVGYSGNEFSFINSFTKEDIENNIMDFFEGGIIKSLWEKTLVIEGINSAEEFNSYMAYINNKYKKLCKIRLLKKFKPRNVLRVLKRKVKAIIKG